MSLSRFFVDRPVFAGMISLAIFLVFGIVYRRLTRHMPGASRVRWSFSRL